MYFIAILGVSKTFKNNLTIEEGQKLKEMIATLSGPQQMTVIEILSQNKESLPQDHEGNITMELLKFNQTSIDKLKAYVFSVTRIPASSPAHTPVPMTTIGQGLSDQQNISNLEPDEDHNSDDSSSTNSTSSSSDSDSDSDKD